MSLKLRAAISALLLAPQAVLALGLGDIRLNSALNEPLSAEIELVAPTSDELIALSAQLAPRELFQRYGLDRPAYLDSVQFTVGRGRDGRNVLIVNSAAPISEPFVTFLVEVNWPRGRLLREYTVLLDPPVFAPQETVPPTPVAAPRAARPAPAPAPVVSQPAPVAPRQAPAVVAEPGSSYRVQPGDTLYGLASRYTGGDRTETNRMMIAMFRANPEAFGGNINVLRSGSILRVPGPEALAGISAGEAASEIGRQTAAWRGGEAPQESARLRLVTPTEAAPESTAGEPVATDPAERIAQLNREIEESQRLIELKNAELARLQQQVADEAAAAQAASEAPAATEEAPAEAPVEEAPVAAAPPEAPPPAEPRQEPPSRSFVDGLTDNWQYVLGAAVLLLGGGLAWGYLRRRREEEVDEAIRSFEPPPSAPVPSETQRLRQLTPAAAAAAGALIGTSTEDQELEEFHTATLPPSGRKAEDFGVAFEDTLSAEEPGEVEQGDPLAEADFHMAYGLYDQAADIVRLALDKEPGRRDLQMKLLEIFFVSGDKANFLEAARRYAEGHGDGEAADWDRVLIMGRQLAPDDALFESEGGSAGVDLNLEGGDSRVDLELLAPPEGEAGIDLDLGEALEASGAEADTGQNEALDFDLDLGTEVPTREMPQLDEQTAEMPAGDSPTVESSFLQRSSAEVTVEETQLDVGTGKETVEETRLQPLSPDQTAEVAVDDLGIDLGDLEELSGVSPDDDVTRVAPIDDSTLQIPEAEEGMDFDLSDLSPEVGAAGTAEDTQRLDVDMDVGVAMDEGEASETATEQVSLDELPEMSELEPVTLSEVGTKLDLARAYVDMGDPEGARSILEEVLKEGSASQKQEAHRLLDSLPGA